MELTEALLGYVLTWAVKEMGIRTECFFPALTIDNFIIVYDFFNFPTSLHMVTLDTYLIYGSYKFFGPM